ncbi:MAG TPA: hypothetical protein ENI85_14585 [Deltaproteobacteria bacterium]|nr:hypothetical protein [Deltaproteobacteria bacterium]
MNADPFRRRYGHGAGRLPVGIPIDVDSLSTQCRDRSDHESAIAAIPVLFLIGLSLFFAVTIRQPADRVPDAAPLAMTGSQVLELEFFEEAPIPPPVAPRKASRSETRPGPVPVALPAAPIAPRTAAPPHRAFDPAQLAMKPISQPMPLSEAGTVERRSRRPARPSPRRVAAPAPALAIAGIPDWQPAPARPDSKTRARLSRLPRRPVRGAEASSDPALLPEWSAKRSDRRAFLADVAAFETRNPEIARAMAERPPVAAASHATDHPALRAFRSGPAHAQAGWREVPLDELPDCMPPGRQDLLKKRILLAAPSGRECSHRDGSYRFVETRNLGAFLMWSRTHPDRRGDPRPIRDACDVLEQALRCLEESSTKESNIR